MKKFFACLLAVLLAGCGFSAVRAAAEAPRPLSIVCSTFPSYDWVRQILGEDADGVSLTLLLDDGADLHNYQPTVADIAAIQGCDLFVYVGGESDGWAESILAASPQTHTLALLDWVDTREEETVEGMEHDDHDDHDHDDHDDHDHDDHDHDDHDHDDHDDHDHDDHDDHGHGHGQDEHVWLSLRRAERLVGVLARELGALRPEAALRWQKNADAYIRQLQALDEQYTAVTQRAANKTLLFADRFPFRYLAEDYGLSYYAAFSGCSAETEASFETVLFLVSKLRELQLPAVLTIESSDGALARTVIANAGMEVPVLEMNSCQSVTAAQLAAGKTYLALMEGNLAVLAQALE